MRCQRCHRRSAAHELVQIGVLGEYRIPLCGSCLMEMGLRVTPTIQRRERSCPQCAWTWKRFMQSGRLGCGHCYTCFREALLPLVAQMQADVKQPAVGLQQESSSHE